MSGYSNSLGQLKGLKITETVLGNKVLTSADMGKYIYAVQDGFVGVFTLPNPATLPEGWNVIIKADPATTLDVNTAAGTINGHATFTLKPESTLMIVYTSSGSFTASYIQGLTRDVQVSWGANGIVDGQPTVIRSTLNGMITTLEFPSGSKIFIQWTVPQNLALVGIYSFSLFYMPNNTTAGNFDWDVRYQYQAEGDLLTTFAAASSLLVSTPSSGVVNQLQRSHFNIPAPASTSGVLNLAINLTGTPNSTRPLLSGVRLIYPEYSYTVT